MEHRIITGNKLQRLLGAAANVQTLMDDGTLAAAFEARDPDCTNQAVTAFDALNTARAIVAEEIKAASPFLRYRREIMADTPAGAALRAMVLSLYGRVAFPIRDVFEHFGEHDCRVALECLTSFAANGDRDSQFMSLGLELAQGDDESAIEVAA